MHCSVWGNVESSVGSNVEGNVWVDVRQSREGRGGEEWAVTHPGNGESRSEQKGPRKHPRHCSFRRGRQRGQRRNKKQLAYPLSLKLLTLNTLIV